MGTNERRRLQKKRHIIILLILLVAVPVVFLEASTWARRRGLAEVSFTTSVGESPRFYLEVASTPASRQRGLMFRKEMPVDEGMIFIFPGETQRSFWMKNTYISLDLVFVTKEKKVLGVVHSAPILTEQRQSVPGESSYVIELNAGTAKKHGIQAGSSVSFHTPLPRPIDDKFV